MLNSIQYQISKKLTLVEKFRPGKPNDGKRSDKE